MVVPIELVKIAVAEKCFMLFVPEPDAVEAAYRQAKIGSPYWSQVWPAAIALSEFIMAHPVYVKQKRVLELGAGLGLPSFIASEHAASVLCTDVAREAIDTVQRTAAYHSLINFETGVFDWLHLPEGLDVDVLLLSDINYDLPALGAVRKMINAFLASNTTILLSTPQRLMGREFISGLLPYCVHQEERIVPHAGTDVSITVMVLRHHNATGNQVDH
jgi:predicted nicotinamide N-methyase